MALFASIQLILTTQSRGGGVGDRQVGRQIHDGWPCSDSLQSLEQARGKEDKLLRRPTHHGGAYS